MGKISVAILGATGCVGQRFISLLQNHPWFEIKELCASEKNQDKKYADVVLWKIQHSLSNKIGNITVNSCDPDKVKSKLVFSALDSKIAGEIEKNFAIKGHIVVSNSKNHRMVSDVPLLVPEINPDHLGLIKKQKERYGSNGFIITNPNCSTVGLVLALKPLLNKFGIKNIIVSTMQALSGAGYPGVPSMDALDNVIPFINEEEEKIESESLKILGKKRDGKIINADFTISAHCNRVSVRDGHLLNVTAQLKNKASIEEIIKTFINFKGLPQNNKLPSAPLNPIIYKKEVDRPQPVLDRHEGNGMTIVIGRVRNSSIWNVKFSLLVHNTIRGAAGASILNAELLKFNNLI